MSSGATRNSITVSPASPSKVLTAMASGCSTNDAAMVLTNSSIRFLFLS
jgi:hypothetical protein